MIVLNYLPTCRVKKKKKEKKETRLPRINHILVILPISPCYCFINCFVLIKSDLISSLVTVTDRRSVDSLAHVRFRQATYACVHLGLCVSNIISNTIWKHRQAFINIKQANNRILEKRFANLNAISYCILCPRNYPLSLSLDIDHFIIKCRQC